MTCVFLMMTSLISAPQTFPLFGAALSAGVPNSLRSFFPASWYACMHVSEHVHD